MDKRAIVAKMSQELLMNCETAPDLRVGFAEICAAETIRAIETADRGKMLEHPRKANLNRTIAKLCRDFWEILLEDDPKLRDTMFQKLCANIALRPEPVRRGCSSDRKSPRNKRFPLAKKSVLP